MKPMRCIALWLLALLAAGCASTHGLKLAESLHAANTLAAQHTFADAAGAH